MNPAVPPPPLTRGALALIAPALVCLVLAILSGGNGPLGDLIPLVCFGGSALAAIHFGWVLARWFQARGASRPLAVFGCALLCYVASVVACFFGCNLGFSANAA